MGKCVNTINNHKNQQKVNVGRRHTINKNRKGKVMCRCGGTNGVGARGQRGRGVCVCGNKQGKVRGYKITGK